MKRLAGAVFDVDGTLLDSMSLWLTLGETYVRSQDLEPKPDLQETLSHMTLWEASAYMQTEYGITKMTRDIQREFLDIIHHYYAWEAPLKKGIPELLNLLNDNDIPMAIATATDRPLVEAALCRLEIRPYFRRVYTCGEVGFGKSNPFVYDRACASIGTKKKDTLIFEDALSAIRTAKRAGYPVAAVFDASERNQEQVLSLADYYFKDWSEFSFDRVIDTR